MADDKKPKLSKEEFEVYKSERIAAFEKAKAATIDYRDAIIDVAKKGPNSQTGDKLTTTADAFGKASTAIMDFAQRERDMGIPSIALKTEGQMTEVINRIKEPAQKAHKSCDKSAPTV